MSGFKFLGKLKRKKMKEYNGLTEDIITERKNILLKTVIKKMIEIYGIVKENAEDSKGKIGPEVLIGFLNTDMSIVSGDKTVMSLKTFVKKEAGSNDIELTNVDSNIFKEIKFGIRDINVPPLYENTFGVFIDTLRQNSVVSDVEWKSLESTDGKEKIYFSTSKLVLNAEYTGI